MNYYIIIILKSDLMRGGQQMCTYLTLKNLGLLKKIRINTTSF